SEYLRDEALGRTTEELGIWTDPKERRRFVTAVRREGGFRNREFRLRTKSGRLLNCLLSGEIISVGDESYILTMCHDITERKQAEERLIAYNEQLRSLSARLQTIREEERAQIAREIHDDLGQALTVLKMDTSWLMKSGAVTAVGSSEALTAMLKLIDGTISHTRRLCTHLRPAVLDDLGLVAAVEWQAQEFQNRTGIECVFSPRVQNLPLNSELSTAVFRIFQESLTNVARHSQATKVFVTLEKAKDLFLLKIEDNGRGIREEEINHTKSLGLLGMRERAHIFGGELKVGSRPGGGTEVSLRISLAPQG
ncbi:MAG: PAS domain-containing sensor histidine kinase, partial [Pseudomonadota bacterium]